MAVFSQCFAQRLWETLPFLVLSFGCHWEVLVCLIPPWVGRRQCDPSCIHFVLFVLLSFEWTHQDGYSRCFAVIVVYYWAKFLYQIFSPPLFLVFNKYIFWYISCQLADRFVLCIWTIIADFMYTVLHMGISETVGRGKRKMKYSINCTLYSAAWWRFTLLHSFYRH